LIDVSTGGNVPDAPIPVAPGYQVPFAAEIRDKVGIATAAVGMITEPRQAEEILQKSEADAVLLAREFLRDPYFPFRRRRDRGEVDVPKQYGRAIDLRKAKRRDKNICEKFMSNFSNIPFSVLDLSPVIEGATPADALRNTLSLAQHAKN
jgi:2,4-dienoyl-CoA reductase-like NADH-dependent reductase (Old Yellow Enzyme family)